MVNVAFATSSQGGHFITADNHDRLVDELIVRMGHQIHRGRVDPEARAQNLDTLFAVLARNAAVAKIAA
jgi:hypothetical protein